MKRSKKSTPSRVSKYGEKARTQQKQMKYDFRQRLKVIRQWIVSSQRLRGSSQSKWAETFYSIIQTAIVTRRRSVRRQQLHCVCVVAACIIRRPKWITTTTMESQTTWTRPRACSSLCMADCCSVHAAHSGSVHTMWNCFAENFWQGRAGVIASTAGFLIHYKLRMTRGNVKFTAYEPRLWLVSLTQS